MRLARLLWAAVFFILFVIAALVGMAAVLYLSVTQSVAPIEMSR